MVSRRARPVADSYLNFLLGWLVGDMVTPQTLQLLRQWTLQILVMVVILMIFSGVLAWVLWRLGLDPRTAFLATSPGGLSQMTALSNDVGPNAPLVALTHIARVLAVFAIVPLVRLLR